MGGGLEPSWWAVPVRQEDEDSSFEVLSQTTWAEKVCLFLGSLLALVQGATAPLVAMFTGNAVTVLQTSDAGVAPDARL